MEPTVEAAIDVARMLSVEVGPRRPCSQAEHEAGERLVEWLRERSVDARLEPFEGYPTFAIPYGAIFGAGLAGGLAQKRAVGTGTALVWTAIVAGLMEADLRRTPISDLLSRSPSANVVATIPSTGETYARLVLTGHMDTTRSGLLFAPGVVRHLEQLVNLPAISLSALAAWPLLRRWRVGRAVRAGGLAGLAIALAFLAERETRGEDVAGANDNASGTGVACALAAQFASSPLAHTQIDLLITGCEESGILGAQAYVRGLDQNLGLPAPLFLNFDTVAGAGLPLTFIEAEGTVRRLTASARLVALLEQIASERPELGLRGAANTPGLPTDATVAMAHGYEAVTLLAQSEQVGIPGYHWPTDTFDRTDADAFDRAVRVGSEMLRRIDRDAAR